MEQNTLPDDATLAREVATGAQKGYYIVDDILYYEDSLASGYQ